MDKAIRKPKFLQLVIWFMYWFVFQVALYYIMASHKKVLDFQGEFIIEAFVTLFWLILYFKSISYDLQRDQVRIRKGIFRYREIIIPNTRILNAYISRSPLQKLFGIGTVHIQTNLPGVGIFNSSEVRLEGIEELKKIRELIVERATYEEIKNETIQERNSEVLRKILEELKEIKNKI